MIFDSSHRRRTALFGRFAFALLAGALVSCRVYRPVQTTAVDRGSPREYARLRLLIRGGYVAELVHAVIRPDSVVGIMMGDASGRRVAVARDRIVRIDSYERDVRASLVRATLPPPDDANGGSGDETVRCPVVVNAGCVTLPKPQPLPSPTPAPTPE